MNTRAKVDPREFLSRHLVAHFARPPKWCYEGGIPHFVENGQIPTEGRIKCRTKNLKTVVLGQARSRWWGCGLVLLAGSLRLCAGPATAARPELASSPLTSLFRVLGGFALVLAAFGGILWALRNWQRLVVHKGVAPKLRVLESKALGQRHALYIVGYESERLLLSASPSGVSLLTHLPPGAVSDEKQSEPVAASKWVAVLDQVLRPYRG